MFFSVKNTVAVTIVVLIILVFAVPVFAQSMTHNVTYKMSGTIDLEKQVGHLCNTGGEMKQTIKGEGEMTKTMNTTQVAGRLTVSDEQEWVTAEDATRNLTVTTVIELCAPPKTEYDVTNFAYGKEGWGSFKEVDGAVLPPTLGYPLGWEDAWQNLGTGAAYGSLHELLAAAGGFNSAAEMRTTLSAAEIERLREEVGATDGYAKWDLDGLTNQIWAVQVSPDPGFSGALTQNFEAAYGAYEGRLDDGPAYGYGLPEADHEIHQDAFGFRVDDDGYWVTVTGDDYVGNYFNIDQFARTSQGTVRRYIDISSPWSHAYLYEDMEVVGMAEIEESFVMDNLAPGAEAVSDWWDLF